MHYIVVFEVCKLLMVYLVYVSDKRNSPWTLGEWGTILLYYLIFLNVPVNSTIFLRLVRLDAIASKTLESRMTAIVIGNISNVFLKY